MADSYEITKQIREETGDQYELTLIGTEKGFTLQGFDAHGVQRNFALTMFEIAKIHAAAKDIQEGAIVAGFEVE